MVSYVSQKKSNCKGMFLLEGMPLLSHNLLIMHSTHDSLFISLTSKFASCNHMQVLDLIFQKLIC